MIQLRDFYFEISDVSFIMPTLKADKDIGVLAFLTLRA
jgi:hypothetical protein